MMESIEELRGYIRSFVTDVEMESDIFNFSDEIEREIAEKYMLLPVVDGKPVHIGDELEWTDGYGQYERFTVGMIGRTCCNEAYEDFVETHEHGMALDCCRWPKPDAVKELLEELVAKVENDVNWRFNASDEIDCMTARIREAVSAE